MIKKRLSVLLSSLLIILSFPQSAKAAVYPTQTSKQSYNYNLKTGDNLIAHWNSMFTESEVDNSYKNGMTGKFTWDNWVTTNEINGKGYSGNYNGSWISGGYNGYLQGGASLQNAQNRVPLSELGVTSATSDITISFWYKWDGTNGVMPIGFTSYDLYIVNGYFGFNTSNSDIYGIPNPFKAGQYTHVTAKIRKGNVNLSELYINGVKSNLSQCMGSPINSNVKLLNDTLCINGWIDSTSYRSPGAWMDELYIWNRGLSEKEISNLFNSFEHTTSYLKDTKMRMTFDNNSVSNDLTGKLYSSANNSYVDGKKLSGLKLDGDEIKVPLSDLGFVSSNDTLTVSYWYKSDLSRTYKIGLGLESNGYGFSFNIYECKDSGGNEFFGFNTGNAEVFGSNAGSPFLDGKWHHVVLTAKTGKLASSTVMYIDGTKQALVYNIGNYSSDIKIDPSFKLRINTTNKDYNCNGTAWIDEVMVWNRELTGKEVKSLSERYGNGTAGWGFSNYWETFSYNKVGSPTGLTIKNDSSLNMNYIHMNGSSTVSDSGVVQKVENLKPNTWYTASGYVRADNASSWGNGTFFITNSGNSAMLQASSLNGMDLSNWVRNSVTFNTGSNTSIYWRINRGNHTFVDVTALKLEEGKYATPFISYNDKKTYGYGVMDNLISPHDSYFLNHSSTSPQNNWEAVNNSGVFSTCALSYNGYKNYNYYHMTPSGGKGLGDSGAMLRVPNLEPNTDYTVGAWMRIPNTSKNNGKGRIFITNSSNGEIASINPKDSSGKDITHTNGTWQYVSGTFNTGSNTSAIIRINRGDADYLDWTLTSLQGGKNPIDINSNGYEGKITPKTVTFAPKGSIVNHHNPVGVSANRNVTLSDSFTDSNWYTGQGQMSYPAYVNKSYYDAATGQTYTFSLGRSSEPYQSGSSTRTTTTTTYETRSGWKYDISNGVYHKYDPVGHTTLGYMSNNSSTYYGGSYSYNRSPRPPRDYYGHYPGETGWTIDSIEWADSAPLYYKNWNIKDNYNRWRSDAGSGSVYNNYRKGVYIVWKRWASVQVPVTTNVNYNVYQYKVDYRGTFSLPDTVDNYEDYQVTRDWNVTLDYDGTLYPRNLHAINVAILDMSNNPVTKIAAGQNYKARINYSNNGDVTITNNFNIGLYDNNNNKLGGTIIQPPLIADSTTKTAEIVFTIPTVGDQILYAKIDDTNDIVEVDETDNIVKTGSINVYNQNLKTTYFKIVGLNDETEQASLIKGNKYRAKVKVKNDGSTNISNFSIGLYGLQAPPPEDADSWPDPKTQLGTDYIVNSLNSGEELGVTPGKGYAYINFIANSTDIHSYSAWADNKEIIDESNEYDNIKSLAVDTLVRNVRADYIKVVSLTDDTVQATLKPNQQYRLKYSITNTEGSDLIPLKVGIDDITGGSKTLIGTKEYQLYRGQTVVDYITFTATQGGLRTYQVKADYDDSYVEINENDNIAITTATALVDLKLINYRITNIVNPPSNHVYPIGITKMPAAVKAGYNVTLQIDVEGVADKVTVNTYRSGNIDSKLYNMSKVRDIDPTHSVWECTINVDINTPLNTVIYSTVIGNKGTFIYNFNSVNKWNGATLFITGNALDDFIIQRVY